MTTTTNSTAILILILLDIFKKLNINLYFELLATTKQPVRPQKNNNSNNYIKEYLGITAYEILTKTQG